MVESFVENGEVVGVVGQVSRLSVKVLGIGRVVKQ